MRNVYENEPEKQLLVGSWEEFCVAALVFTTISILMRRYFQLQSDTSKQCQYSMCEDEKRYEEMELSK